MDARARHAKRSVHGGVGGGAGASEGRCKGAPCPSLPCLPGSYEKEFLWT